MKTKSIKMISVLIIAFLAVILLGTTNVKAKEGLTKEEIQTLKNEIPETMQLDIPEIEYEKAEEKIKDQLIEILKNNGIELNREKISAYIRFFEEDGGFYKANVLLPYEDTDSSGIETIKINIEYNNHDKYNSADEQYIQSLNLKNCSSPFKEFSDLKILEVKLGTDFEDLSILEKYFANIIKDDSYTIKTYIGRGASTILNSAIWDLNILIFKDEVLYELIDGFYFDTIPVIMVPSTVAENEINDYVLNLVRPYFENNELVKEVGELSIVKEPYEELSGQARKADIKDGYAIKCSGKYTDGQSITNNYVIVRKEGTDEENKKPSTGGGSSSITNTTVSKADTTTGIKLEGTTSVISNNIQLVVKPLESSKVNISNLNIKKFVAHDIKLLLNGNAIQPNGKVKISIPVPKDFDDTKLTVYRIADNGEKTEYKTTVETKDNTKYATFETDHFSTYILAEKETANNNTGNTGTPNKAELDETPKTGDNIYEVCTLLAVIIIANVGLIIYRIKK